MLRGLLKLKCALTKFATMDLLTVLQQPVPGFSDLRHVKEGYRRYPLLSVGSRNSEPLVAIDEYGLAGQSYYSRPNSATKEPIPEVSGTVYLRRGIVERLARINYVLQCSSEVEHLLGGKVELYIDEGFRSAQLQARLYNEVFPHLLKSQHPDWTRAEVAARVRDLIAEPSRPGSPSPHLTGAAVDLSLRYAQANLQFVPHCRVSMLYKSNTSNAADPDYFEYSQPRTKYDNEVQRNRRIFYWVMKGALLGDDSGFVVNPTEWWHWSYGDQLWAQLTHAPEAFYGAAAEP